MIRQCILAGGFIYILITIVQIVQRPSLAPEAVVTIALLGSATAFYLTRREHGLHTTEAVGFWACVLLFAAYGILKFWGGA